MPVCRMEDWTRLDDAGCPIHRALFLLQWGGERQTARGRSGRGHHFDPDEQLFHLQTKGSSYAFKLVRG